MSADALTPRADWRAVGSTPRRRAARGALERRKSGARAVRRRLERRTSGARAAQAACGRRARGVRAARKRRESGVRAALGGAGRRTATHGASHPVVAWAARVAVGWGACKRLGRVESNTKPHRRHVPDSFLCCPRAAEHMSAATSRSPPIRPPSGPQA